MSLNLADVLSPTPQMPKAAGGVVAALEAGEGGGAFAEALKAFRAGATETTTGEAGIAIAVTGEAGAAVPELPVRVQTEAVIGLEAVLVPAVPTDGTEPTLETPPVVGAPVTEAGELPTAPVLPGDALPETAGDAPDAATDDATDPNLIIAAPVAPGVTPAAPVVTDVTTEDVALKIAGATDAPEVPSSPQPQLPLAPAMPDGEAAPDSAPLLEGRASAAGAPPPPVLSTGDAVPELPKEVVESFAPRAVTPPAEEAAVATKPVAPPPAPSTQSAPIPAPMQAIAAEPDVVSVQAKVVADTDANEDGDAPASTATPPLTRGTERAVPAAPSVPTPAAQPEPILSEPVFAADPETKAKAADGALAVLTEKPETPAAAAKPAPVAEPDPAAKPVAAAAPAPAADPALDVKTPDTKEALTDKPAPEKPVAERSAPAAEKPAPQADSRTPQAPLPVNDKPASAELAAKSVQQQSQNLPAAAIPQIAGEIVSKVKRGVTRFEIRLDPPELGRIDVRIDVDKDGRVMSRLMVEKTETLDLLKADQRALERALHDAGFKSDQNSLSFSLKDQRGDGQPKFDEQRQLHQSSDPAATEEEPVRHVAETAYRAAMRGPGGFDLRV